MDGMFCYLPEWKFSIWRWCVCNLDHESMKGTQKGHNSLTKLNEINKQHVCMIVQCGNMHMVLVGIFHH
jgi:hypothetical protein